MSCERSDEMQKSALNVFATPYIPRDTLALTLNNTKAFPERDQLVRFIRFVTSKTEQGSVELLDRVAHGVSVSIALAAD
jgi:hypothetical protein